MWYSFHFLSISKLGTKYCTRKPFLLFGNDHSHLCQKPTLIGGMKTSNNQRPLQSKAGLTPPESWADLFPIHPRLTIGGEICSGTLVSTDVRHRLSGNVRGLQIQSETLRTARIFIWTTPKNSNISDIFYLKSERLLQYFLSCITWTSEGDILQQLKVLPRNS